MFQGFFQWICLYARSTSLLGPGRWREKVSQASGAKRPKKRKHIEEEEEELA